MASLQSGNSNFVHIGLSSLSIVYVNACFQEQQQKHNKKKRSIMFPFKDYIPNLYFSTWVFFHEH